MRKSLTALALAGAAVALTGCASYPQAGVQEISAIADAICGEDTWVGEDFSSFGKADEGDLSPTTFTFDYSVTCLEGDDRDRSQVAEEVAALVGASLAAVDRERGRVINPDSAAGTWSGVSVIGAETH